MQLGWALDGDYGGAWWESPGTPCCSSAPPSRDHAQPPYPWASSMVIAFLPPLPVIMVLCAVGLVYGPIQPTITT